MYTIEWLKTPQFIIGTIIFIIGMVINLHSDYIIRHLRKPGDTAHYIPMGGMFSMSHPPTILRNPRMAGICHPYLVTTGSVFLP